MMRAGDVPLDAWRRIWRGGPVSLDPDCAERVAASAAAVQRIVARGEPVYGVNTGFGKLSTLRIDAADLTILQRNIVLSHSVGVGAPASVEATRLMMALKLASLAQGASGVRPSTLALIEAMLQRDVLPVIPAQGSVGASGDLAPLAHMAAAMIGVGEVCFGGLRMPAADGLGNGRAAAGRVGGEGGAGAAQRHAVFLQLRARRPVRDRARVSIGVGDRRAVDRRRARLRHAVRPAHPRSAPASRPDRSRRRPRRADARQRDPRFASAGRPARAGPLLPALPAAGDGGLSRSAAPMRARRWKTRRTASPTIR